MNFDQAFDKVKPILSSVQGQVCSFGFVGEKAHRAFHKQACHAKLDTLNKGEEFYYSTVCGTPDPSRYEAILRFTNWALSDDSPWAPIIKDKDRGVVVNEGAVVGYVLQVKPEDDALLLKNLSIALRLPGEYKSNFDAYVKLLERGVPDAEAYYLGALFKDSADTVIKGVPWGHTIIDSVNHTRFDLKRFAEGRPYEGSKKLNGKKATGTFGVNKRFYDDKKAKGVDVTTLLGQMTRVTGRWCDLQIGVTYDKLVTNWQDNLRNKYLEQF